MPPARAADVGGGLEAAKLERGEVGEQAREVALRERERGRDVDEDVAGSRYGRQHGEAEAAVAPAD